MNKLNKKYIIASIVLILFYVLLGNSKSVQPNIFIPGDVIAVSMIVPVIGGILFGRWVGLWVGIIGTFLNYLSPAGTGFELLSILPHGIMGFLAGYFQNKIPSPILACTLIVGHLLNIAMYLLFDKITVSLLMSQGFWLGIAYETFLGVVAIILIAGIFRLGFKDLVGTHE